jgi:para-aminobenzoate synthetase component 1
MSFYSEELPYRADPASYFAAVADLPCAAWLDSGGLQRFDIITAAPMQILSQQDGTEGDVPALRAALGSALPAIPDIPFAGGLLGYWSYDWGLALHGMTPGLSGATLPELQLGLYDWALVLDHTEARARLVSHCRFKETLPLLAQLSSRLRAPAVFTPPDFSVAGDIVFDLTPTTYQRAFAQVERYLHNGDCYQINLAQRFAARAEGNALAAYLALRKLSPAPYAAFLDFPGIQVLSASPEQFLRVENEQVVTRPIKGTRPRGVDPDTDRALAQDLATHPKDRAENLMIVDLLRNDLGKHCVPGSVNVPELFQVESYASVHHLVSTIIGQLLPGHHALDLLRDSFPGGSITGAPKRRAMEIIDQLESHRRGLYCGSIGYVGFDGNMDTNIAIRTLTYSDGQIQGWAGGGIVADSEWQAEYQETLDKAAPLLKLLRDFGATC